MGDEASGRFAIPRQRRFMLERPRLTSRLHAAIGNGLTLLHAPAGFGKTALLSAFAREASESGFAVRWLTLDSSCNSPEVFAAQLSRAIHRVTANERPATADKPDDLKAFVGSALRAEDAGSPHPLLLIIDNVHELADALETAELLGWLIQSLPESGEVILSGRAPAPLTLVDTRVATGEAVVLDSGDLAFSLEDVRLLVKDSRFTAEEVHAATGGWPAAVMAVLAGTVPLDGAVARQGGGSWEEYLTSQIWAAVPESIRPHVRRLSVAGVADPALGRALMGRDAWERTARWLDRHDFLFEMLEDGTVRLNPLFRRFVLKEFRREMPGESIETADRVAGYLEQRDQVADAIEVALEAEAPGVVCGLLERNCRELLLHGSFALLERGYRGVPLEDLRAKPLLRAMRARVLAHTGRPGEALDNAALSLDDSDGPPAAHLHALLARHRALRLLARPEELEDVFSEIRAIGAGGDDGLRAEVAYHEAHYVLSVASDFNRAEVLLRDCMAGARAANAGTLELLARSTLGQLLAMRGDSPAAIAELVAAARGWRERGGSSNLAWVLNNLGCGYLSVGDFQSAVPVLSEAVEEGRTNENSRHVAYATASLADGQFALGNYQAAREQYEEAIRICSEDVTDESLSALSITGLALCFLGLGDIQQADYFVERAGWIVDTLGNPYDVGMVRLARAAICSGASDHSGAVAAAREAAGLFESINAAAPLRQAYYRLSLCQFRAGRRTEAQAALERLAPLVSEPWMLGALLPAVREQPMFAQWAVARGVLGIPFRELLEHHTFGKADAPASETATRHPKVAARSLGRMHVAVGGRDVDDEAWESARAKELFFLFLAHRQGLSKEQAFDQLFPDTDPARCNSAFHSNLHRVRKALYRESVIKSDGNYMLNPEGEFEWDVEQFEALLAAAATRPAGSEERARAYREALELYRGPFAEAFYSEWAEALRRREETHAQEALSTLAGYFAGRGDYEGAAGCMERLLELDGADEDAAYHLASYRAQAGRPAAALSFLDTFAGELRERVGVDLPDRFRELRRRIAAGVAV